jgi:hypothetical protein
MEGELTAAPAPRRHRRKASDAAAAALAAASFGGPPRFAGGAPADYAEVFGGVAASCSIPYLDLPPPIAAAAAGAGDGEYGEIFAQFDFGEFAAPYEDALAAPEEIGSPSGSSRYQRCPPPTVGCHCCTRLAVWLLPLDC